MKRLINLIVPAAIIISSVAILCLWWTVYGLRAENAELHEMVYDKYPVTYEGHGVMHYIEFPADRDDEATWMKGSNLRGFDADGNEMFTMNITGPSHEKVYEGLKLARVK